MRPDVHLHRIPSIPALDPLSRLLADLPAEWRGTVIGPGIVGWQDRIETAKATSIAVGGLSHQLRVEVAWMAHWQFRDGVKVSVSAFNQIVKTLEWAADHERTVRSLTELGTASFAKIYASWFASQYDRLPGSASDRLRTVFTYAQLALTARMNEDPWWTMDYWIPRCDPRIPLRDREPGASARCSPVRIDGRWLREASNFISERRWSQAR